MSLERRNAELEHVAEELLRDAGAGDASSALDLARRAGLTPVARDVARAVLGVDGTLAYDAAARPIHQERWIAEQLAGFLLRRAGIEDSRSAVAHTAAALLLPRERFALESDRLTWNLRALQELYPNVTMGTLGLRIAALHPAAVTWFDKQAVRWRSVSPDFADVLAEPTRFEQHLAEIAIESDMQVNPGPRLWAFTLHVNLVSALVVCDCKSLLERTSQG